MHLRHVPDMTWLRDRSVCYIAHWSVIFMIFVFYVHALSQVKVYTGWLAGKYILRIWAYFVSGDEPWFLDFNIG